MYVGKRMHHHSFFNKNKFESIVTERMELCSEDLLNIPHACYKHFVRSI